MVHQNILYIRRVLIQGLVHPLALFEILVDFFNDILIPWTPTQKKKN